MVAQNLAPPVQFPALAPYADLEAAVEISVSEFDYSVENHFKAVDTIVSLCRLSGTVDSDQSENVRFSNSITFLREWRDFNYASRVVRFAFQHNSEKEDIVGEVTLPQFSAASVPKFVAVAAHPPESSYHKIGAPLSCRGVIQIWCVLAVCEEEVVLSQCNKKPRPTQKKGMVMANEPTKMQRPRGRPRKKPLIDPLEKPDAYNQNVQPLAVEYPEGFSRSQPSDKTSITNILKTLGDHIKIVTRQNIQMRQHRVLLRGQRKSSKAQNQTQVHNNDLHMLRQDERQEPSLLNPSSSASYLMNSSLRPHNKINCTGSCDTSRYFVPKDVALPRMMLCLAHNGKVAWDIKWRPYNGCDPQSMKRMGYLAVLVGNGALEVWDLGGSPSSDSDTCIS